MQPNPPLWNSLLLLPRGARRARPWQRLLRGQGTEAGVIPVLVQAGVGGECGGYHGAGAVGVWGPRHTHIGQARLTLDLPCSCAQFNHAPSSPRCRRPTRQRVAWSSWLRVPQGGCWAEKLSLGERVCATCCPALCDVSPPQPLPSLLVSPPQLSETQGGSACLPLHHSVSSSAILSVLALSGW